MLPRRRRSLGSNGPGRSVLGVSGGGTSTVGALLAGRLQWEFKDGHWLSCRCPQNAQRDPAD